MKNEILKTLNNVQYIINQIDDNDIINLINNNKQISKVINKLDSELKDDKLYSNDFLELISHYSEELNENYLKNYLENQEFNENYQNQEIDKLKKEIDRLKNDYLSSENNKEIQQQEINKLKIEKISSEKYKEEQQHKINKFQQEQIEFKNNILELNGTIQLLNTEIDNIKKLNLFLNETDKENSKFKIKIIDYENEIRKQTNENKRKEDVINTLNENIIKLTNEKILLEELIKKTDLNKLIIENNILKNENKLKEEFIQKLNLELTELKDKNNILVHDFNLCQINITENKNKIIAKINENEHLVKTNMELENKNENLKIELYDIQTKYKYTEKELNSCLLRIKELETNLSLNSQINIQQLFNKYMNDKSNVAIGNEGEITVSNLLKKYFVGDNYSISDISHNTTTADILLYDKLNNLKIQFEIKNYKETSILANHNELYQNFQNKSIKVFKEHLIDASVLVFIQSFSQKQTFNFMLYEIKEIEIESQKLFMEVTDIINESSFISMVHNLINVIKKYRVDLNLKKEINFIKDLPQEMTNVISNITDLNNYNKKIEKVASNIFLTCNSIKNKSNGINLGEMSIQNQIYEKYNEACKFIGKNNIKKKEFIEYCQNIKFNLPENFVMSSLNKTNI